MFTGIVEELGEVLTLDRDRESARITVQGPLVATDIGHGQSVAVNGCCLTVIGQEPDAFTADVMAETLKLTCLGELTAGSRVNLERAVAPLDRLGGHLVQGHVDGVGRIVERAHSEHWDVLTFAVPARLLRYVALKGSIAVDGVSLTVSGLSDQAGTVSVSLIPATLELTTLGRATPGDLVNLEVDVVAKYVERLLAHHHKDG
jgi:riboflavin synthase